MLGRLARCERVLPYNTRVLPYKPLKRWLGNMVMLNDMNAANEVLGGVAGLVDVRSYLSSGRCLQ
jgi:hypothetical protein